VKDGLIEDPRACKFDPASIQCKGADGTDCLTAPQVTPCGKSTVGRRIRAPGRRFIRGIRQVWRDYPVRGRRGSCRRSSALPRSSASAIPITGRPCLKMRTGFPQAGFRRRCCIRGREDGAGVEFVESGFAVVPGARREADQYHGWGDAAIPPQNRSIITKWCAGSWEYIDARSDARKPVEILPVVPGAGNGALCGGAGPNAFGNGATVAGATSDPERDLVAALDGG